MTGRAHLPLAGKRVIDFGEVMAGPFCCSLLADLGAEVIKIESTSRLPALSRGGLTGPSQKKRYGYRHGIPGDRPFERYTLFHNVERNKLGLTLDLGTSQGKDLFASLVGKSHAVVSNYSAGTLARLGFPNERLHELNPNITIAFMPAYGSTGPYRNRLAFGQVTDMLAGRAWVRGYPETAPYDTPLQSLADSVAGTHAAIAVLLAMAQADGSGAGAVIDVSHAEAMQQHLAEHVARAWLGQPSGTRGNRETWAAPHNAFPTRPEPDPNDPCADDHWIAIAVHTDAQWEALAEALGGGLRVDARFATLIGRKRNEEALESAIGALTREWDRWGLAARLQSVGVPAIPVITEYDSQFDRSLYERGVLAHLNHPWAGPTDYLGPIARFTNADIHTWRPANALGQDNADVLGRVLELDAAEIAALEEAGVIGSTYKVGRGT